MEQSSIGISVEKPKKINRPKYKSLYEDKYDISLIWKKLFIGMVCLSVVLVYMLCMVIKGNNTLQREATHTSATK